MRTLFIAAFVVLVLAAQGGTAAAQTVGDIENGKKVFTFGNTSCTNCHGVDGIGGFGPDLAGKGITVVQAATAIRKPTWKMPAFVDDNQVTNKEITDMVAYWNSLPRTKQVGKWRTGPIYENAPKGQQLAVNIIGCAQCHGATLSTPRHGAATTGGGFEWFKNMVYNHSKAMPEEWALTDEAPPAAPRRVRMGNYDPVRVTEPMLQDIWTWINDLGLLVPVEARLSAGPAAAAGTTYTLNVENGAVPDKGLSAEDVTITLVAPPGTKVVSGTGTGYAGVKNEGASDVASWRVPKLAPHDKQTFTVTLSGTATGGAVPRGKISWAKPAAKADADVNFTLPRPGGRGAAAN